jgi:hypothetical protein
MIKKPYIIALEEHYQDPEVKRVLIAANASAKSCG